MDCLTGELSFISGSESYLTAAGGRFVVRSLEKGLQFGSSWEGTQVQRCSSRGALYIGQQSEI